MIMNKTLVIGRNWKFLDFLVPCVDSIINHNDCVDLIVIDSQSSRSKNIESYCNLLLRSGNIRGFIQADDNYLGNIWKVNQYLKHVFSDYDYICMTDLDLKIVSPKFNWINNLTDILERRNDIGAVSIDFEPMPPVSDHFVFVKDHPELKLEGENFWNMLTDGWFYTVRKNEFMEYLNTSQSQLGPGMHGYNDFCYSRGRMIGRTDIIAKHYGWLRYDPEWNGAYNECGLNFKMETSESNNQAYLGLQGNWNGQTKIPTRESFRMHGKI